MFHGLKDGIGNIENGESIKIPILYVWVTFFFRIKWFLLCNIIFLFFYLC